MYVRSVYLIIFINFVQSLPSTKELEGYPTGYLADCPGSNKEAIITKRSLHYLSFTVQGAGGLFVARRAKYTYYQMEQLAKDPDIDFSRPTLLYVGGYLDSASFPFARAMGREYKNLGYNALLMDANKFVTFEYPMAARYMRPVGKHIAQMLANLTHQGLNPKKLELIGLSLGGQTISYIAKNYRHITGMNISRITALDPSGPCFRNLGPDDRLDQSDADFVDVIATNIDGYGMASPVGHVNFYVNGGEFQPGDIFLIPCNVLCSHIRAYTIWIAALNYPNSFKALQCESVQQARDRKCYHRTPMVTNVLGLNSDRSKPGIFYLATKNNYPYYLGDKGLDGDYDFIMSSISAMNENNIVVL